MNYRIVYQYYRVIYTSIHMNYRSPYEFNVKPKQSIDSLHTLQSLVISKTFNKGGPGATSRKGV